MSNPKTSGSNTDGSNSIAKESKAGLVTAFIVTAGLQVLAQGLGSLDTSKWQGWWVPLVTAGIGVVTGLAAAWRKKNV